MSDSIRIEIELAEAKELYRLLVGVSGRSSGDRLVHLRQGLEKRLFARLSIEEMEILVQSDELDEMKQ